MRRVVVKVGSGVLAGEAGARVERFLAIAEGIRALREAGVEVVLVSSGAIALGRTLLGLDPTNLAEQQALAAVGQPLLMRYWAEALSPVPVAQVLLDAFDLGERRRYLNAKNTLKTLLRLGVLPVVNENDTVLTEEIQFGDNDQLAVLVAAAVEAEGVYALSEADALYDADPRTEPAARPIREVARVGPELFAAAGGPGERGRGGMRAKLIAAKRAMDLGLFFWLLPGADPKALQKALAGASIGTRFRPQAPRYKRGKRWLAQVPLTQGELVVDAGAAEALREKGASLLAVGLREVRGQFAAGAPVRVVDEAGRLVGYGLAEHDAETLRRIQGLRGEEAGKIAGSGIAVHRDRFARAEEEPGEK